jgi:hypothetical protein
LRAHAQATSYEIFLRAWTTVQTMTADHTSVRLSRVAAQPKMGFGLRILCFGGLVLRARVFLVTCHKKEAEMGDAEMKKRGIERPLDQMMSFIWEGGSQSL